MLIVQTKVLQGHALVVTAILNHQCHNQPHPWRINCKKLKKILRYWHKRHKKFTFGDKGSKCITQAIMTNGIT